VGLEGKGGRAYRAPGKGAIRNARRSYTRGPIVESAKKKSERKVGLEWERVMEKRKKVELSGGLPVDLAGGTSDDGRQMRGRKKSQEQPVSERPRGRKAS